MKNNLVIRTGFLYVENYIHIMRTMQKSVTRRLTNKRQSAVALLRQRHLWVAFVPVSRVLIGFSDSQRFRFFVETTYK